MKDCDANNAANEMEIVQMLWIDSRVGVDLQRVDILSGILKEAIVRIEHFVRQQIEPFTSDSAVICKNENGNNLKSKVLNGLEIGNAPTQTLFAFEFDH